MPRPLTLAKITAGVGLAAAVFVGIGYFSGRHTAGAAMERLELLWPQFQKLPPEQRLLLAKLAIECDLAHVAPRPPEVVQCLRDGASALDRKDAPELKWAAGLQAALLQSSQSK